MKSRKRSKKQENRTQGVHSNKASRAEPGTLSHHLSSRCSRRQRYQVSLLPLPYGVTNRRIGAAATINLPHPLKKKEHITNRKKTRKEGREGPNPLICCKSRLLKHPSTHSPTQKKTKKKRKKSTKTGKRGLEPAHLASYCCKQYIMNISAAV